MICFWVTLKAARMNDIWGKVMCVDIYRMEMMGTPCENPLTMPKRFDLKTPKMTEGFLSLDVFLFLFFIKASISVLTLIS